MDDLISRKALLAAYDDRHKGPPGGARELIEDAPTVPAVPLDKLCNLLHDLYGAPCNVSTGEDKCVNLIGEACDTTWGDEECWKQFLTKWMEELDAEKET